MKRYTMNYYCLRIADCSWGTGYYSYSVRGAIRQFLKDPLYEFESGTYTIEVRGHEKPYVVTMSVVTKTNIKFKKG